MEPLFRRCAVVIMICCCLGLGCDKKKEKEAEPKYDPNKTVEGFERVSFPFTDSIKKINARQPRIFNNIPQFDPTRDWPTTQFSNPEEVFARCIRQNGTVQGSWAVLALTPTAVEAAIQLAVKQGLRDQTEVETIRKAASRQLFKANARTFAFVHNSNAKWQLREEPHLISMKLPEGGLVGTSVSMLIGLERAKVGILMFENVVSSDDVSYAIKMYVKSEEPKAEQTLNFIFEGDGNILSYLQMLFAQHQPPEEVITPPQEQQSYHHNSDNQKSVSNALSQFLGVAGLALEIIKLIKLV